MSKPKLSNKARKAKPVDALSAWWYENENSIDVLAQVKPGRSIVQLQISRRQIESWLKKLPAAN
jgi:hypothetical protein